MEIKVEKYPEWCKDDVDKFIHETIIKEERELTFTQLKNKIYEFVFKEMAKESLIDRLLKLKEKGIIENSPKETKIEVWKAKREISK